MTKKVQAELNTLMLIMGNIVENQVAQIEELHSKVQEIESDKKAQVEELRGSVLQLEEEKKALTTGDQERKAKDYAAAAAGPPPKKMKHKNVVLVYSKSGITSEEVKRSYNMKLTRLS